jgi:PmbA protein
VKQALQQGFSSCSRWLLQILGLRCEMIWSEYIVKELRNQNIEQYEIYHAQVGTTSIEVKDQQVECFTSAQSNGVSLRVLKDNRAGFSYCTECNNESFDQLIANAVMSAKNTPCDECNIFPEISKQLPDLKVFDESAATVSKAEKIERAKNLETAARSYDPKITKIRKAGYQENISEISLVNSSGCNLSHRGTFFSSSIVVVAEENNDSQMGWDFDFSRFYKDIDINKIARAASSRAIELLGARSISSFKGQVILDNSVSCQFLGVLAPSLLSESVQKNKSLLQGKINDKIFSDRVDIIDDGLYPGGIATSPFDGEGVSRQSTSLVHKGVLKKFLYDAYCARKDNTQSTGNSTRGSFKSPPGVGYSNLYIKNGTLPADMITSYVEKGVLINEVMGIHTANPISGDFSVGVNGFLIEKGKKTIPVKGIAIAGNIMTLFNRIVEVGSDLRFFGKIGAPSLMIEEMDISGN